MSQIAGTNYYTEMSYLLDAVNAGRGTERPAYGPTWRPAARQGTAP